MTVLGWIAALVGVIALVLLIGLGVAIWFVHKYTNTLP
jgi:ABC-type glycerol-3-phosphate transport system permease component